MDWDIINDGLSGLGTGRECFYLVSGDVSADGNEVISVRLTRWRRVRPPGRAFMTSSAEVTDQAARNAIVFPFGRGPGRPAGEPEVTALMAAARQYAERYEAGESLEGYPQWQHAEATSICRDESSDVRRLMDAEQQGLVGVDGHTERGHSPSGPPSCRRCELLRENQGWMWQV
jgi:hypothetical protein